MSFNEFDLQLSRCLPRRLGGTAHSEFVCGIVERYDSAEIREDLPQYLQALRSEITRQVVNPRKAPAGFRIASSTSAAPMAGSAPAGRDTTGTSAVAFSDRNG